MTTLSDRTESALLVVDKWYADPATARRAGLSRAAVRARHFWTNAAALASERRTMALGLVGRALGEFPPGLLTRPALAS